MGDGIEVDKKSIADPKYSESNPHPEYSRFLRNRRWSRNSQQYKENYNKIDWKSKRKDAEDKCTDTNSEKSTESSETTNESV